MTFVIDASVAGTWLLPDEQHLEADALLDRLKEEEAYVPTLFWFEIRNLLIMSERRQRMTPLQTATALQELQKLPIRVDGLTDSDMALKLARDYRLSLYDASYLELTIRLRGTLYTFDRQLAGAAQDLGGAA